VKPTVLSRRTERIRSPTKLQKWFSPPKLHPPSQIHALARKAFKHARKSLWHSFIQICEHNPSFSEIGEKPDPFVPLPYTNSQSLLQTNRHIHIKLCSYILPLEESHIISIVLARPTVHSRRVRYITLSSPRKAPHHLAIKSHTTCSNISLCLHLPLSAEYQRTIVRIYRSRNLATL